MQRRNIQIVARHNGALDAAGGLEGHVGSNHAAAGDINVAKVKRAAVGAFRTGDEDDAAGICTAAVERNLHNAGGGGRDVSLRRLHQNIAYRVL